MNNLIGCSADRGGLRKTKSERGARDFKEKEKRSRKRKKYNRIRK